MPSKDEESRNLPNPSTRPWSLSTHYSPLLSLLAKFPALYLQLLPPTADSTTSKYSAAHSVRLTPALATDATFWLASATKLFTAVAALQCVDKGLVSLDEDISHVLPELKTPVILKGWDENEQPILEEAKTEISLRFVYYISPPTMAALCSIEDRQPMRC